MKTSRLIRYASPFGLEALGIASAASAQRNKNSTPVHAEFRTDPAEVRAGE